jgi:hypothetical protein
MQIGLMMLSVTQAIAIRSATANTDNSLIIKDQL